MEKNIFSQTPYGDVIILAGDIGGTNTNIAIVSYSANSFNQSKFVILAETVTPTKEITSFIKPLHESLEWFKSIYPSMKISCCCISGAGPIQNNYCKLTNANWDIDGALIENTINIKTFVINDFVALSYGIPYLNIDDINSIVQFPSTDGSYIKPQGTSKAVIGAGTGLGVGFIPFINGAYVALPSEGGHFDFPAFDKESAGLREWFIDKMGINPGMERFVSGQGLSYCFAYLLKEENPPQDEIITAICNTPEEKQPPLISKNAFNHPFCAKVHKLYRRIYGKMAGNYATIFLPTSGLYIAGGVISKDLKLFLSDNTFIQAFSINHKENISALLKNIPVYVVKNYSTSLLGTAAAAVALQNSKNG